MRKADTSAIERYLDGTMEPAERSGFERRLSADGALRQHLEAERMIRTTIDGELATMPTEHAATRAHMMKALDALPPTPPAPPTPAAPPTSPLLKWLGATGAAGLVVAAGYLLATRDDGALETAPRDAMTAPAETSRALPAAPQGLRETAPQAATDSPRQAPSGRDAGTAPSRDAGRESRASSRDAGATDVTQPGASVPSSAEETAARPKPRELRVIDRDSVKVRVGVEEVQRRP